jgi:hypothetical protein
VRTPYAWYCLAPIKQSLHRKYGGELHNRIRVGRSLFRKEVPIIRGVREDPLRRPRGDETPEVNIAATTMSNRAYHHVCKSDENRYSHQSELCEMGQRNLSQLQLPCNALLVLARAFSRFCDYIPPHFTSYHP